MNTQLQDLIEALIESDRNPKQIAMVLHHAYKLGVNDGAAATIAEVAKTLGHLPNKEAA